MLENCLVAAVRPFGERLLQAADKVDAKAAFMSCQGRQADANALKGWSTWVRNGLVKDLDAGNLTPETTAGLLKMYADRTNFSGAVRSQHKIAGDLARQADLERRFPVWAENQAVIEQAIKGKNAEGKYISDPDALKAIIAATDAGCGTQKIALLIEELAAGSQRCELFRMADCLRDSVDLTGADLTRRYVKVLKAFERNPAAKDLTARLEAVKTVLAHGEFSAATRSRIQATLDSVEQANAIQESQPAYFHFDFWDRLVNGKREGVNPDWESAYKSGHRGLNKVVAALEKDTQGRA